MLNGASEEAIDLIKKLLSFNPKNRLTVEQALEHPYVKDFHSPEEEISCNRVIPICMNDNKKFSIKEYRELLYKMITKKKSEEHKKEQEKSVA
jgi:mitogen-activated protein kinase 15